MLFMGSNNSRNGMNQALDIGQLALMQLYHFYFSHIL